MTVPRVMEGTDLERGPSPHLAWSELDCRDGTPYPQKWRGRRAIILANEFEVIRRLAGNSPIKINSAYRTADWNRLRKGARKSQHVQARAIDLGLPVWISMPDFLEIILEAAHRKGSRIRGIGVYRTFIHFDTRSGERIARWRGSRVAAEVFPVAV